jgi:hypothetical protein
LIVTSLVIVEKSLVTLTFRPTVEVIDESMLWEGGSVDSSLSRNMR